MKCNRVWIVELWFEDAPHRGWTPSVGCRLTRDEARKEKIKWLNKNTGIKTRVVKYEARP